MPCQGVRVGVMRPPTRMKVSPNWSGIGDGEWGTEKKGRVSACRERAQDRPCGLIWADLVAEWERAVACLPCPPLGGVLACYEETAKSGSLAVRNGDSLCIDYALSSY